MLSFKEGSGAAYWRVFEYLYTGTYKEDLSTMDFEGKLSTAMYTSGFLTASRRPNTTKRSSRIRTSRHVLPRGLERAFPETASREAEELLDE